MNWLFVFSCISGFYSILYAVVWLRSSMAVFGVPSALVSIVPSMFMAGLALESWGSWVLIRVWTLDNRRKSSLLLCSTTNFKWTILSSGHPKIPAMQDDRPINGVLPLNDD